jgi:hypothetical protein
VSLLDALDWLSFLAFTVLAVWALALSRRKVPQPEPEVARGKKKAKAGPPPPPPLPANFLAAANGTHLLFALLLVANLFYAFGLGQGLRAGFLEYMVLFTGGGVVYARGQLPGGWAWRVLTNPPKVSREFFLASAWCATAVLGFIARSGAKLWNVGG